VDEKSRILEEFIGVMNTMKKKGTDPAVIGMLFSLKERAERETRKVF
jgi:hypothetical protein